MYTVYLGSTLIYKPVSSLDSVKLIDAKLTEELNKAAVFTATMPPGNAGYASLLPLTSTLTVYDDSEVVFIGRPVDIETDFYGRKKMTCEGPLAWLNDGIMRPYKTTSVQDLMDRISGYGYSTGYNEQAGSTRQIYFTRGYSGYGTYESDEYRTFFETINDTVLPIFGDDAWARVIYHTHGNVDVDFTVTNVIPSSNQTIRFGRNLLDLNVYIDPTDIYTVVIPLGKDMDTGEVDEETGAAITAPLTIESVHGVDWIQNNAAVSAFGRITAVVRYPDIEDASELLAAAQKDLAEHTAIASRFEINAVDLSRMGASVDKLRIGYSNTVVSPHGVSGTYRCTKIVRDLMNPAKSKYTFGKVGKMYSSQAIISQAQMARATTVAAREAAIAKGTAIAAKITADAANTPISDEELDDILT